MARYIKQGHIRKSAGTTVSGATVTVYLTGTGTLANIYTASSGGSVISGSQVTSNANGYYIFFVDDTDYLPSQRFALTIEASGLDTTTYSDVDIVDVTATPTFTTMYITAPTSGATAIATKVTGDAEQRFFIDGKGAMFWGSGAAAQDVNLYRNAANVLKSDDKIVATAGLGAGNTSANTNTPSGATARALEIFDASGASLGFIPIYAAEW